MDEGKEGLLLIGTTTALLFVFLVTVLSVMLVYRRRKLIHQQEIQVINEKYQRELLQTQLEVQRETMQYIGREIHDNVGHQLTLAFLYTQQDSTSSMMEQVSQVISNALADLRNLSASLTHNEQQWDDLPQLLRDECQKLQSLQMCEITGEIPVKKSTTTAEVNHFLVRIVQEFTQNSLKHAECEHIHLTLTEDNDALTLTVKDDGKGFTTAQQYTGMGLHNMKRRSEIIGAAFELQSQPGQGTAMILKLPKRRQS